MQMYSSFNEALVNAASLAIDPSLEDFENKFAPTLKPDYNEKWLHFLLNLVTLGVVMITAPYFNSCKCWLPLLSNIVSIFADYADGKMCRRCHIS